MIQIYDLEMGFGERCLFGNVNLNLMPGSRYGLIGANGSGKSTFLEILIGHAAPREGKVVHAKSSKVGFLSQDQFDNDNRTVLETVMHGRPELLAAMHEKEAILAQSSITEADGEKLANLEMIIADHDGYTAEAEASEILAGLGIVSPPDTTLMRSLSGGFKIRALLARCLFSKPDTLLLDEPTNNLDIHSIIWLENYLKVYRGLLVLISHDIRFLSSVADQILDVDYEEIRLYKGGYEAFVRQKEMDVEIKERTIEQQEKQIEDKKKFIERFGAKASKARQANSRKKQLENMPTIEIKRSSRISPRFQFKTAQQSGKETLKVNGICKAYGENKVLNNIGFTIGRGEKVGIIGVNGIGKSTLLKIIAKQLKADQGVIELGYNVTTGYFSQNHMDLLPAESTPYEWLYSQAPGEEVKIVRSYLGRVLISGDDVHKKNSALSGGEAARLIIAQLMHAQNNLLLLDEPTNHMDIETVEAFAEALRNYPGTILFVSHDRFFTDSIANRIIQLTRSGVEDFVGSYSDYSVAHGLADSIHMAADKDAPAGDYASEKGGQSKDSFKARKQLSNMEKKLQAIENRIAEEEKFVEELSASIAKLYSNSAQSDAKKAEAEVKLHQSELEGLLKEWETVHAKLEELQSR